MRAKLLSNHVGARRMAFGSRHLKWDQFNFFEKLANSLIRVILGSPHANQELGALLS